MKVWVTRNKTNLFYVIDVWVKRKPVLNGKRWESLYIDDLREQHSKTSFKEKYGFTPRKGSCKQYKLTLEEL